MKMKKSVLFITFTEKIHRYIEKIENIVEKSNVSKNNPKKSIFKKNPLQ